MLRPSLILAASVALLFAASTAFATRSTVSPVESALLSDINQTRIAHGLQPLSIDPTLVQAARSHSLDMLRRNYFAHGSLASRMLSFHAHGPVVGENIAWGGGSHVAPATVIREWLESPDHRRNLLRPGFRRIGIGAVSGAFLGQRTATVFTVDFAGQ